MGGKKNQIRKTLRKLKSLRLKTWQLLLILIPLFFIDATLLRINHLKMVELRDAVLIADEDGDETEISNTIEELKNFTFNHIIINIVDDNGNPKITFGTGPFYLEHQYTRAATKALEDAENSMSSDDNPNGNVYLLATNVCKPLAIQNGWAWNNPNYIDCMLSEIDKYPTSENLQDQFYAQIPSTELYRKNYASPIFTPSLVGFLLLFTAIIIVVIFIRFLIWCALKITLLFL